MAIPVKATVIIPAFLSMRSKPVSMNILAVCLFITISSCFGFIIKSRLKTYYRDGEDAFLMAKDLS